MLGQTPLSAQAGFAIADLSVRAPRFVGWNMDRPRFSGSVESVRGGGWCRNRHRPGRAGACPLVAARGEAVDRSTFETRLRMAAQQAVQFARQFVREALPDDIAFLVYPNQSCDENPRVGDEEVFPGDSLAEGGHHGLAVDEVVSFLWRGGKVPEYG